MEQSQLDQLRDLLLAQKKEIDHRLQNDERYGYGLKTAMADTIGEFSMYDNHPADIATELYEREKDLSLRENDRHHLQLIDQALHRMKEGTYGVCLKCGREIPFARLEAEPTAAYCIEHAQDNHISHDRPVEEEFLYPPFGRTDFDERDERSSFDGEDAWQSVARYGTSDPADYFREGTDYNDMYVEADEPIGYVDLVEGFIVNGIDPDADEDGDGEKIEFVRNDAYLAYLDSDEGDGMIRGEWEEGVFDEDDLRTTPDEK